MRWGLLTLLLLTEWPLGAVGVFLAEPKDLAVPAGCEAIFSVVVQSEQVYGYTYQWYLGGDPVPGATTRAYAYRTTEVTGEPASYWVVAKTQPSGCWTSQVATLTVGLPGECRSALPKLRMGGQKVSLVVKAEKFLPLALINEIRPQVNQMVGVTNLDNQRALCFGLNPWLWSEDFTWEDAQTVTWPETFLWKDKLGINSVVMGYYSSNGPVMFSWNAGGILHSNGLYQRRCALITPRFTITHGHAPPPKWAVPQAATYEWVDWLDAGPSGTPFTNHVYAQNSNHVSYFYQTNFVTWFRFVGTNNDVHWRYSMKQYDYWNNSYDWPETNTDSLFASNEGFSICLLNEDLPSSVVPVSLMPTNLMDYATLDGVAFGLPTIWLDRHNWAVLDWPFLTDKESYGGNIPSHFMDSWIGSRDGNSSHPVFYVLNGRCVERNLTIPQQELLLAAMRHMWAEETGQAEETCQMPDFVDLSGYQKLR